MSENSPTPIVLGPFELGAPLGRGGMGEVWAATHRGLGTPAAVKVITDRSAREERFRIAFRNEVRAVARLDHPGIVQVYDFGQIPREAERASGGRLAAGSPYLVMELLDGGSLRDRLGRLDWPAIRALLLELLDALGHAHARGVVHRDLKPDNVLWGGEPPRLRLTDFGVAHAMDHEPGDANRLEGLTGPTVGTPAYMAPEQVEGRWRDQGPWTDLYAVGCLAWEMMTGQSPYRRPQALATIMAHLTEPLPDFAPRVAVPDGVEAWLRRLLTKDPADRFRRAADAAWALRALAGAPADREPAALPLEPTPPDATAVDPVPPVTDDADLATDVTLALGGLEPLEGGPSTGDLATDATWVAEGPPPGLEGTPTTVGAGGARAATPGGGPPVTADAPWATAASAGMAEDDAGLPARPPPVPETWRGAEARPTGARLPGVGLGLYGLRAVPFVGREAERDVLWRMLRRAAAEGRARAVSLTGPSGYGKSRLAEWLCQRAHELGAATILQALHAPIEGPAHGAGSALGRFLRCTGLPRPEVLARVRRELARLGAPDETEAQALTELICPATGAERSTAGVVRFGSPVEAYAAIARFLGLLARRRPVVVWLDDVQWSRHALDFTAHLLAAQAERPAPILVLLTARSEALAERPDEAERLDALRARDDVSALEIGPLDPPHRPALLEALLGLEGELARRLDERTGGNPLFAVQVVGDWVQRGVLEPGPNGFRLKAAAAAATMELPASLQPVWARRVERLLEGRPVQSGVALELAAVLGQEVDGEEWRRACAIAGIAADPALVEALLDQSLARCGPQGPAAGWAFVHGMLRETLEHRARAAGRWADHHRTCARMLELNGAPGSAERVGRHLVAAGDPADLERAVDALAAAARERIEGGDYAAAAALLTEREAALERLGAPASDPRWGEGWVLASRVAIYRGRPDEAAAAARRAEQAAADHGWTDLRPELWHQLGVLAKEAGRYDEAEDHLRASIAEARARGDRRLAARALEDLGGTLLRHGRLDEAEATLEQARAELDAVGESAGAGRCEMWLTRLMMQAGRLEEARQHCRASRALFEAAGARNGIAACDNQLGELARVRGDLRTAEIRYRDALRTWEAIGAGNAVFARANLALVLLERGEHREARPLLETALARFEANGQRAMAAVGHACLLPCAADAADWDDFDGHLERAAELLSATGLADVDAGRLLQRAGDLARAAGEAGRARRAYELAAAQWRSLDRAEDLAVAEAALAALEP